MNGVSLLAQVAVPQSGRSDQMRDRRITVISVDDGSVLNHAVPRPDLVPRRMCIRQQAAGRELRVLVANSGPVEADSFNVGLVYGYGRADTLIASMRGIGGLAAGRSAWFTFEPTFDSNGSLPATYTAIADPRYTFEYQAYDRDGNSFTATGGFEPRIPEGNEQNNSLTLARTGIDDCVQLRRQWATPVPVNPR